MITKYKFMRSFKKFVFFACLLVIWASNSINAQKLVQLFGTSENKTEKYISINKAPQHFEAGENFTFTRSGNEGKYNISFNLSAPELLIVSVVNKSWAVHFHPGDSLSFLISGNDNNRKLAFSGNGQAKYNLDVLTSDAVAHPPYFPSFNNLTTYKTAVEEWRKISHDSVTNYLSKHVIDTGTAELARKRIDYCYVTLIYTALGNVTAVIPLDGYLEGADQFTFADDQLLQMEEYRTALRAKFINVNVPFQPSDLKNRYEEIMANLMGESRDFALTALAGVYSTRQSPNDSLILRNIFAQLHKQDLDSNYTKYLRDQESSYFVVGKMIPNKVLDNTFVNSYEGKQEISLATLLERFKGRAVYINLWASDCQPCRDDITRSSEIKHLLDGQNVAYLYFSTDKNEKEWKTAIEQDQKTSHQYRFCKSKDFDFKKFASLSDAPQYILLDKEHRVKSLFAPPPLASSIKSLYRLMGDRSLKKTK